MSVGLLIAARMGSARLPGKALRKLGPFTALGLLIERLKSSRHAAGIVVATTDLHRDDAIAAAARNHRVSCFRGDAGDVLGRLSSTAQAHGFELTVRLTGDCPLNDPAVVDACVEAYRAGDYDYVTTKHNFPMGIDCEVLSTQLLRHLGRTCNDPAEREHVTLAIWRHPERFRCLSLAAPRGLARPDHVLTLDEEDDLRRLEAIVDHFGDEIVRCPARDILDFLRSRPELIKTRAVPRGL